MNGNLISDALLEQIRAAIKYFLATSGHVESAVTGAVRKANSRFRTHRVILDADIDANTDPLGVPPGSVDLNAPNATILRRSVTENKYTQTDLRLSLSNDSDENYSRDDCCYAVWQDGRYTVAGCPQPVSNRPQPPWWPEGETWPPESA